MKTCAFTGHRPQNLPFGFNEEDERCIDLKKTLREQIINLIENEGVTHFISGMAIGVDMYAAEIVLGLKASYPGITLESAIPCESQAAKWSEALRDRYFDIASKCDKETLIQTHYSPDCMDKRNRYMVDHADVLIAVWDGSPSGTGKTVNYALRQGKPVVVINPRSLSIERRSSENKTNEEPLPIPKPGIDRGSFFVSAFFQFCKIAARPQRFSKKCCNFAANML